MADVVSKESVKAAIVRLPMRACALAYSAAWSRTLSAMALKKSNIITFVPTPHRGFAMTTHENGICARRPTVSADETPTRALPKRAESS